MFEGDSLSPQIDRSRFEQIVAALLDRRNDPKQIKSLFAREAVWQMNGDPAIWAYAGLRASRESILAYLTAFSVEFEQKDLQRLALVIEGEQACVQYEMTLRHRGTGREARLQCLCFIRVEGESIIEVSEFIDSATLFRLRESTL